MFPFLKKKLSAYIKRELYSNFWTFEIASLPNVPGHYLKKYGIFSKKGGFWQHEEMSTRPVCLRKEEILSRT